MDNITRIGLASVVAAVLLVLGVAWNHFDFVWGGDTVQDQITCGQAQGHIVTVFGLASTCEQ